MQLARVLSLSCRYTKGSLFFQTLLTHKRFAGKSFGKPFLLSVLPLSQRGRTYFNGKMPVVEKGTESSGDQITSGVIKSPNDLRDYRIVTLCNGLKALLVSDINGTDEYCDDSSESEDESSDDNSSVSEADETFSEAGSDDSHRIKKNTVGSKKKAAAALCIGVGGMCDPPDIQGLSHFLEHMVFMGSKKYPQENKLDDFLAHHGGYSNAWTDYEATVFYFNVQRKYFEKSLDIFAQFFISPLMRKDSVDRELEAVDSEFEEGLTDDDNRTVSLLANMCKPGHPISNFIEGNIISLKKKPAENKIDVYSRLKEFHKQMYSSHYMTLAVQSRETLDVLEKWVREIFSGIPNNKRAKPTFDHDPNPFDTPEFARLYRVVPIKETHKVSLNWALPPLLKRYRAKPLDYLSTLFLHEGPGSILSALKKRMLALQIEGGNDPHGFEFNSAWSCFYVDIILTDSGVDRIYEILTVVFQYVQMLQKAGPQRYIFDEEQAIEDSKFRWQEKGYFSVASFQDYIIYLTTVGKFDKVTVWVKVGIKINKIRFLGDNVCCSLTVYKEIFTVCGIVIVTGSPVDYVQRLSENMQLYAEEDYLTGDCLYFEYDSDLIQMCMDHMKPEKTNVILQTKKDSHLCMEEEKWYGTKYMVSDFDSEWLEKMKNLDTNPDLFLPDKNKYLAKDFSLMEVPPEQTSKHPFIIMDTEKCKLWFKKDTKFNVPKAHIYFKIKSPVINESLESAVMFELFIDVLLQKLSEPTYHAIDAGLSYALQDKRTGMIITVKGFNDKLMELFKTIIDEIIAFDFSDELFEVCKSQLLKDYYNHMIKPYNTACNLHLAVIEQEYFPVPEKYSKLPEVTPDMMRDWFKRFCLQLFFEGFVIGNASIKDACDMMRYVVDKFDAAVYPKDQWPERCLLTIPKGQFCCQVESFNPESPNSTALIYYQVEPGSIYTSCLNEMLVNRMQEPLFDILRTQHQLGYSVSVQEEVLRGILGFSIAIEFQSHKFTPEIVNKKVHMFINDFINIITLEEFQGLKESLITAKQCEDTKLAEESRRHWHEISIQTCVFDRLEKEIEALQNISFDGFLSYVKKTLLNDQHILNVQVVGKKPPKKKKKNKKNASTEPGTSSSHPSSTASNSSGHSPLNLKSAYSMLTCRCVPGESNAKCVQVTNIADFKKGLNHFQPHKILS